MARKPSAETENRTLRRELREARYARDSWRSNALPNQRRADHHRDVLQAIANGHYPGDQAKLAAKHALQACGDALMEGNR